MIGRVPSLPHTVELVLLGCLVWAVLMIPMLLWLRRVTTITEEEDAKLYALAERLEQTGGFPRSRR